MSLSNCTFTRATEVGLYAHGVDTHVTLDHITIVDPQPRPWDSIGGIGLYAYDGAHLTAHDLALRGTRDYAVVASGAGTVVNVTDLAVSHTQLDGDGLGGIGISAMDGGALTIGGAALTELRCLPTERGTGLRHLAARLWLRGGWKSPASVARVRQFSEWVQWAPSTAS